MRAFVVQAVQGYNVFLFLLSATLLCHHSYSRWTPPLAPAQQR